MTTKPIAIHLDRLADALAKQGVKLGRAELLAVASGAFGHRSPNETSALSQKGALTPEKAQSVGRVTLPDGQAVMVLRDPYENATYAVDADWAARALGGDRKDAFGQTPYGHLVDLRGVDPGSIPDIGSRPVAATRSEPTPRSRIEGPRFVFAGTQAEPMSSYEGTFPDFHEAERYAQALEDAGQFAVITTLAGVEYATEGSELPGGDDSKASDQPNDGPWLRQHPAAASWLRIRYRELAISDPEVRSFVDECFLVAEDQDRAAQNAKMFGPDWKTWERDLKRAARHGREPISDHDLDIIRHAVADNHVKSSSSERSLAEHREYLAVRRKIPALLARLDKAEEALGYGLGTPPKGAKLYRITAVRDGTAFEEHILVEPGEDPRAKGLRRLADAWNDTVKDEDLEDYEIDTDHFGVESAAEDQAVLALLDALDGLVHKHPTDPSVRAIEPLLAAAQTFRRGVTPPTALKAA